MLDELRVPLTINPATLAAFEQRFIAALQRETTKVIVLTGHEDSFCIGMDLNAVLKNGHEPLLALFCDVLKRVKNSPKPVIAKVEGKVIAGGIALLAMVDIIIASNQSSFSLPETRFGLTPSIAMCCLLERIKPHQIRQWVWQQKNLSATQALEWGVVDELATPENLTNSVTRMSQRLSSLPATVITQSKQLLGSVGTFEQRLDGGRYLLAENLSNPQILEKIRCYLDDIHWLIDNDAED